MKILVFLLFFPLQLLAQDIAGVWKGTLYNDETKQSLQFELAISNDNGQLSGYSYVIFVIDSTQNIGVKSVKIKKSGDLLQIEDDKLIYDNYPVPPAKGVKTFCNLVLAQNNDSSWVLSGPWKTNRTRVFKSIGGNIVLQKKIKIEQTLIIPKLKDLGLAKSLSFVPYNNYANNVATAQKPLVEKTSNPIQNAGQSAHQASSSLQPSAASKDGPHPAIQSAVNNPQVVTTTITVSKTVSGAPGVTPLQNNLPSIDSSFALQQPTIAKIPGQQNLSQPGPVSVALHQTAAMAPTKQGSIAGVSRPAGTTRFLQKATLLTTNSVQKNVPVFKADSSLKNLSKATLSAKAVDQGKPVSDSITAAKSTVKAAAIVTADSGPVSKAAADISSRQIEAVQTVTITSDSLLLNLYDDGTIDGDTVSVLLNGKVIIPMLGLTEQGMSKTIYLTPEMGDSIVLIMYAENLGSIPPNTGLLIVHDGEARHEIRFSGDLQKNAAIILKRKKKSK